MQIREATGAGWPGILAIMEPVVRAGETYTWDRDSSKESLRVGLHVMYRKLD
ncbi:hypothetical protein ACFQ36_18440 [Arthrobacter sp. GCM10027362]|uniref:hypothetical protein n=1 Tax=Arthrobacter sp. GCM10027362 TaxID=3273379 RepID=UPI003643DC1A